MTPDTIDFFYKTHSGKVSDKWAQYISVYDRAFAEFREKNIDLLEIGTQNGGSLEIWARYFKKAEHIVGCDINEKCSELRYDDQRISVIVGDATAAETQARINGICPEFDIVLDDGSHKARDIVVTFEKYFPHLRDNGLFVVEDLHCSYWPEFDGGLFLPSSPNHFFKLLIDVINVEHWGAAHPANALLRQFSDAYGANFSNEMLASIHSIKFFNSVCVIRKRAAHSNELGERVVAGQREAIVPGVLDMRGSRLKPRAILSQDSFETYLKTTEASFHAPLGIASGAPIHGGAPPAGTHSAPPAKIQLFVDDGTGFSEANSSQQPIDRHRQLARYTFTLKQPSALRMLRLDPIDDCAVLTVEKAALILPGATISLIDRLTANCKYRVGDVLYFDSADPQLIFAELPPPLGEHPLEFVIEFNLLKTGVDAQLACAQLAHQRTLDEKLRLVDKVSHLEQALLTLTQEREDQQGIVRSLKDSHAQTIALLKQEFERRDAKHEQALVVLRTQMDEVTRRASEQAEQWRADHAAELRSLRETNASALHKLETENLKQMHAQGAQCAAAQTAHVAAVHEIENRIRDLLDQQAAELDSFGRSSLARLGAVTLDLDISRDNVPAGPSAAMPAHTGITENESDIISKDGAPAALGALAAALVQAVSQRLSDRTAVPHLGTRYVEELRLLRDRHRDATRELVALAERLHARHASDVARIQHRHAEELTAMTEKIAALEVSIETMHRWRGFRMVAWMNRRGT